MIRTIVFCIALLLSVTAFANPAAKPFSQKPAVKHFIAQMTKQYGFSEAVLKRLFDSVHVQKNSLKFIARPFESKPWHFYRDFFVTPKRIREGVAYWNQHATLLRKAEQQFGVPPSMIVAIIGIESNYGKGTGKYPVLDVLSTLGFMYPPRQKFFKKELVQYLLMTRELNIDPRTLKGSYAGAMGQPQFMPSSYRHYAVDFTGNGKKDLMRSDADIIGSVANYFKQNGWQPGQAVAQRALVNGKAYQSIPVNTRKPQVNIAKLKSLNVHPSKAMPKNTKAILLKFKAEKRPEFWLGFHNFYVITRYNRSPLYAMAAYQLSKKIEAAHRHAIQTPSYRGQAAV